MSNFRMTRGTTTQRTALTLTEGALVYDTDLDQVFVGDGSTAGGVLIAGSGGGISGIIVDDEGAPLATAATTLNFVGNGVMASGTGTEKTIRIDGGGVNPLPTERFSISFSPSSLVQGAASTTVTATVSVNSPFVLTGFNQTEVHSATGTVQTTPQANSGLTGQSTTFTFDINPTAAEVWTISARLFTENASGVAQPDHVIQGQLHVNANWYADARTSAPTALTDLTSRGVYRDGVEYTFPVLSGGIGYIALPNSVSNPTFMSGALFIVPMTTAALGSDYTLYTFSTNDYDGTGTLTVEVN